MQMSELKSLVMGSLRSKVARAIEVPASIITNPVDIEFTSLIPSKVSKNSGGDVSFLQSIKPQVPTFMPPQMGATQQPQMPPQAPQDGLSGIEGLLNL